MWGEGQGDAVTARAAVTRHGVNRATPARGARSSEGRVLETATELRDDRAHTQRLRRVGLGGLYAGERRHMLVGIMIRISSRATLCQGRRTGGGCGTELASSGRLALLTHGVLPAGGVSDDESQIAPLGGADSDVSDLVGTRSPAWSEPSRWWAFVLTMAIAAALGSAIVK